MNAHFVGKERSLLLIVRGVEQNAPAGGHQYF